jgi:hypothetical protein
MSDAPHLSISAFAIDDLWRLVVPDEIGIGMLLGSYSVTPAGRIQPAGTINIHLQEVLRIANLANEVYPGKATPTLEPRQRAWAFRWPEIDRRAESCKHHGPGFDFIGLVHVHRHGKSLPSALDWRRGRHGMPCAILHPGSGALTLFAFRGRLGGQYLGRIILPGLPPPDTPCQPAIDDEAAARLFARDGVRIYDLRSVSHARRTRAAR